jgi:hypothetical protein
LDRGGFQDQIGRPNRYGSGVAPEHTVSDPERGGQDGDCSDTISDRYAVDDGLRSFRGVDANSRADTTTVDDDIFWLSFKGFQSHVLSTEGEFGVTAPGINPRIDEYGVTTGRSSYPLLDSKFGGSV